MKYLVAFLMMCGVAFSGVNEQGPLLKEEREKYLKRAQIWEPTDISSKDIIEGPASEFTIPHEAEVTCTYVEPKEELRGVQPKFMCKTESGEVLRVKYGRETREIYAEVAATRLFWALGFYADEMYPVRLKCLKCPLNPAAPEDQQRSDRVIEDAVVERNFPGVVLECKEDQGFNWNELEKIDEKEGGSPRKHIEALKLLSALIQHSDSKPDNQRLACYEKDFRNAGGSGEPYCSKPVLMIQDLGSTFGSGFGVVHINKMDYKAWKETPIFNNAEEAKFLLENNQKVCIGNLTSGMAAGKEGLDDPFISEEGRLFLVELLNQLTDEQIRDLFYVSGVERLDEYEEKDGIRRKITAEDWATEFRRKRFEINEHRCAGEPSITNKIR